MYVYDQYHIPYAFLIPESKKTGGPHTHCPGLISDRLVQQATCQRTRKGRQGELLVEVVVVEDLGALGTKEVDEEGGVRDLLVQVLKAQPPSSSYNKP